MRTIREDKHGTTTNYRSGCRCDFCKLANTEASRKQGQKANSDAMKPEQHGTRTGYSYGCRCIPCRQANTSSRRDENKVRYQEKKEFVSQYKLDKGCADCGYAEYACALDFDHLPGTEKLFGIGQSVGFSMEKILAEIEKCDVVCAICHRIRTAERFEWTEWGERNEE